MMMLHVLCVLRVGRLRRCAVQGRMAWQLLPMLLPLLLIPPPAWSSPWEPGWEAGWWQTHGLLYHHHLLCPVVLALMRRQR